jgi:GAF domain-containing protein
MRRRSRIGGGPVKTRRRKAVTVKRQKCSTRSSSRRLAYARPTNTSYYAAATYRHTPEFIESQKGILFAPGRSGVVGRVLLEGKSVQIADVFDDPEYAYGEFARRGGFRTILGVPLLREGSLIGLFVPHRAAVLPFTDSQIKLVETFADQAVIAIENARLLNELRQRTDDLTDRTDDLTEALEDQTATSKSSPGHQQLSRRSRAGVCDDAGERRPHLRRQVWKYLSLGR